MSPRHLLSIADLGADGIDEVMRLTDSFVEVSNRAIPKVPRCKARPSSPSSTRTRPAPGSASSPPPSA